MTIWLCVDRTLDCFQFREDDLYLSSLMSYLQVSARAISTQIMHLHQLCQQQLFWFLGNNITYKKKPITKCYCNSPRQKVEHQSAILCIVWHPDGSKISLNLQILRFPINYRCHDLFRYLKIVKNIKRDTHTQTDRVQNFIHTLQWKKLQK